MLRPPRSSNTEELELLTSGSHLKHINRVSSSERATGVWTCCCGTFDFVFFGIDAPLWPIKYGLKGIILLLVAFLLWSSPNTMSTNDIQINIGFYVMLVSLGFLFMAFMFIFTSLVLKQCLIKHVLNQIPWNGNERICDLGCGSGLFLINALVKASPNGFGIGVDKWDVFGQVGICRSNYEQCLFNAKQYRVDERMKLISGSVSRVIVQDLKDKEFDVVVTSWFLHIISDCCKQTKILDEIIRILKPNGYLLFIDIWNATSIQTYLEQSYHCRITSSIWLPMFCTPTKVLYVQKIA